MGFAQSNPYSAPTPAATYADIPAAYPGGGQDNAVQLLHDIVNILTVAFPGDSVKLPPALPGCSIMVTNRAALAMKVYGQPGETINAIASATGIAQAGGTGALYICGRTGTWSRLMQG